MGVVAWTHDFFEGNESQSNIDNDLQSYDNLSPLCDNALRRNITQILRMGIVKIYLDVVHKELLRRDNSKKE